jgi:hypothetical protein
VKSDCKIIVAIQKNVYSTQFKYIVKCLLLVRPGNGEQNILLNTQLNGVYFGGVWLVFAGEGGVWLVLAGEGGVWLVVAGEG